MITLKKTKDNFPNLKRRIRELGKVKASVGYFDELGEHKTDRPNADPISYVDLARIVFGGSVKANIPARPILDITAFTYKPDYTFRNVLKQYFSNIDKKTPPVKASFVYEKLGEDMVRYARTLFGNTNYIQQNKDTTIAYKSSIGSPYSTDPLLEFGALRDNFSMKINGVVVTPK